MTANSRWHYGCSKTGMVSLVFLGLAIVCALISRILLLIAAINISAGGPSEYFSPSVPYFFASIIPRQRVIRIFSEWQPSCAFLALSSATAD